MRRADRRDVLATHGNVSIRIDHHVDGVDPNVAREADGRWLAVVPDDRVLFRCWIKTNPAAA